MMRSDQNGSLSGSARATLSGQRAGLVLTAYVTLSLLVCSGLLAYGSGRGFDLTDEVFYLIWADDPNAYQLVYQPFGYLLNPLFRLVGHDLHAYRLAGFALAGCAGAFLGSSLPSVDRRRAAFTLYGALCATTVFFPWIVTPSYNSAANTGALLAIGGLLNASGFRPLQRVAGTVAGAAGLCIAAFAKPPLFAICVILFLLTALLARHARASLALIAAIGLAAASMSAFLAPAELARLVERISVSQRILSLPNRPLALPAKIAADWDAVPLSLSAAVIAAALSFAVQRPRWARWAGYAAIALGVAYAASAAQDAFDGIIPYFLGLSIMAATAGYAGILRKQEDADLRIVLLLLGAPFAVALGTFNNQWSQLNFSMAFPLLALFTLAARDHARWRRIIAQAAAIGFPACAMILAACYPYSLPASVFAQQVPISPPLARGSILVDPETARFVRSARGLAKGALLVDLSGTGPGVAAVLGAHAPVLPWLNPATETWPDVMWSRMSRRQREQAWFVGPVWPLFERSSPAVWLAAHRSRYCPLALPPITFWGEQRSLQLWRPCPPPGFPERAPAGPRES